MFTSRLMASLKMKHFILALVLFHVTAAFELDLSTANGFQWNAALPNKSM